MGHARALLGTPDRAFQEQLAKRAVAEDLSVREVEEAIRNREDTTPSTPPSARSTKLRPPGLLELEELLGDYLETRVRITMSPRRGRVEVEFATLEDLERIYRVITDGATSRLTLETMNGRGVTARRRSVVRCRAGSRPRARARARGPRAVSAAAPAGSSREKSSHTTAAMRVSRNRR